MSPLPEHPSMSRPRYGAALLLAIAMALSRTSLAAVKWNLTAAIDATVAAPGLANIDVDPYDIPPNCTIPGVCSPLPVALPANTLWYWCGWESTQRTDYVVSKATGTTSGELMRQSTLNDCVLSKGGLKKISSCEIIYGSLTDTKGNYTTRVLGLAFYDPICLLIANNGVKNITFGVQVFQRYDWPRYYGTVFSIILSIILFGGAAAYIVSTCYHEITSPPDRIGELSKFVEQLQRNDTIETEPDIEDESDATDPGTFKGRVKIALTKVKALVTRNKAAQA